MKHIEIKNLLKKDLLVVELAKGVEPYNIGDTVRLKINGKFDNWEVLGKADEIKEEDAKDLVDEWNGIFIDHVTDEPEFYTALESFFSAIESEIYWENPYRDVSKNFYDLSMKSQKEKYNRDYHNFWDAKSRTFDRNRTIIFYKTHF